MNTHLLQQASAMEIDDQIALVEAIWNGIVSQDAVPLPTEAHIAELERRLAAHLASPNEALSWDAVKAAALAKLPK